MEFYYKTLYEQMKRKDIAEQNLKVKVLEIEKMNENELVQSLIKQNKELTDKVAELTYKNQQLREVYGRLEDRFFEVIDEARDGYVDDEDLESDVVAIGESCPELEQIEETLGDVYNHTFCNPPEIIYE
jgi:predicted transcriptional regulator